MNGSVLVVGGGLAGLAATVALAARGFAVTLVEARARLGGRAGSFADPTTGQLIDACQHVSMGCCTNFAHFCDTVGVGHFLEPQPALYFMTPDRRVSRFAADPWPAPFHLGRALASAHYLTAGEKLRVGYGLLALRRAPADADPPLLDWLFAHRQTPRTVARFWGVVLTSALNETCDRVGLKYARKVFVDGFMGHRDGWRVSVPRVPLGRLYGAELRAWLDRHGVIVRENAAVRTLAVDSPTPHAVLRDGTSVAADAFVLAVPFDRVADLLPPEVAADPYFAAAGKLEPSPITSVHLWFDRAVTRLPHVTLVDCVGHWLFNRGEVAPGEHYVQVVVSASRELRTAGRDEVRTRVVEEIRRLFPAAASGRLLRSKIVTEVAATFSAVPGVDALRPRAMSPVRNLALAGDWTRTGWPATMEGAVRSGYAAAEVILARAGRPETVVVPDLDWRSK